MTQDTNGSDGHISIVYFHGMGSQRRFEETSRLVDRLDRFLESVFKRGKPFGKLRRIRARAETGNTPNDPDVTFIRAIHLPGDESESQNPTKAQFYEAYWADEMQEKRSVYAVIKWILRQIWRPITMVWTPWGERQRVKRASLVELLEEKTQWPEGTIETDFKRLLKHYNDFDHPRWTRMAARLANQGVSGTSDFTGFLHMIDVRNRGKPDRIERLTKLARAWRRRYVWREVRNFAFMCSLLLAIVLVVLLLSAGVLAALLQVPTALDWFGLANKISLPDVMEPNWKNALGIGFGILLALGLRDFLVNRLADVEAWSTYAETDEKFRKREAILNKSVNLLTHVVQQPACKRVVVVAHSLGTSVAYDTLLAAVHANRAVNAQETMTGRVDFNKVSHFVTLASPIDKISYFFESFQSPVRRYLKIYEELRGDIGTSPFSKSGRQPHIHWVNIWDEMDIISGPLHSPAAREWTEARVDNVQVNSLTYFNPGAAHNAYFDNYNVIEILFDVIFRNKGNYPAANVKRKQPPNGDASNSVYRAVDFGPSKGEAGYARYYLLSLALAPWAWLVFLISRIGQVEPVVSVLMWIAIVLTALPLLGFLGKFVKQSELTSPLKQSGSGRHPGG
ncbi:hypothetical protein [Hoeflea prorocentri]|uniref:Alpha/beta hydrolase n=1 Tax=Hoeflea prorocentri TaxID=1922333 RepID=A0A9X3UKK4_9HYPH|nr:hypothetical protein [Hoeflea prorocentri]MCY6382538.1 hypothetical protein [Hoeflea prorocentri]MDA5400338.1 hypothetical protein [Hoeflea prorocentri]